MNRSPPAPVWQIALLGGFALRDGSGRPVELSGRKDRALLAFLAASAGAAHSRERLAALLWGGSGERQARDSLKQALLRLRRTLGPAAAALVANRQSVALQPGGLDIDLGRFERLLRAGGGDALEEALALYRGDLLEDLIVPEAAFEDWLAVERQRVRGSAIDAASRLMSEAAGERHWDRAALAARRLLALDPLHEAACRTLMQLHAARGERAQALKLFEALRDRLRRELAVTPEPETVAIHQAIRDRRALEVAAAAAPLAAPRRRGVRLSAQPAFAARWLVRRLDRFHAAWPDCEVVLDASPRLADLAQGEADLAIRRGPGDWQGLARELLVRSRVHPLAAPSLLPAGGPPPSPGALRALPLLHDDDGSLWRRWFAAAGIGCAEPLRGPRILESGLAIDAAIAGQGVVLADLFLVSDELEAGRLIQLSDLSVRDWDYYLVSTDAARGDGDVRRFRDWLLRDTEPLRREAPDAATA